jgi:hypothetical protein
MRGWQVKGGAVDDVFIAPQSFDPEDSEFDDDIDDVEVSSDDESEDGDESEDVDGLEGEEDDDDDDGNYRLGKRMTMKKLDRS